MSRLGKHSRADTCSCHCAVTFLLARRGPCLLASARLRSLRPSICLDRRCSDRSLRMERRNRSPGRTDVRRKCVRRYTRVYTRTHAYTADIRTIGRCMCYARFDARRLRFPQRLSPLSRTRFTDSMSDRRTRCAVYVYIYIHMDTR